MRIEFREEMQNLFDIPPLDVYDIIMKDKTKSHSTREEDSIFLDDQKGLRKWSMDRKDKNYENCVKRKIMRANQF